MQNDDDITMVPIDQLHADFTEDTEPRDDYLLELLRAAYTRKIQCCFAALPLTSIKPFSDFQPTISAQLRQHFDDAYQQGRPPKLMVYEKDDAYIMSDDYDAYKLYSEKRPELVPCIVLNPSEQTLSLPEASKPYFLDLPG